MKSHQRSPQKNPAPLSSSSKNQEDSKPYLKPVPNDHTQGDEQRFSPENGRNSDDEEEENAREKKRENQKKRGIFSGGWE